MTFDERIERLEYELLRAKKCNHAFLCGIVAVGAMGGLYWLLAPAASFAQPAQPNAKEIRANSFILEDGKGQPAAVLAMGQGAPMLMLADDHGKSRILLTIDKGQPAIKLGDKDGKTRAMLSLANGNGSLIIADEKSSALVTLDAIGGNPSLTLEHGAVRARLNAGEKGAGLAFGQGDAPKCGLVMTERGYTCLSFKDANNVPRGNLGLDANGPFLIFADQSGRELKQLP